MSWGKAPIHSFCISYLCNTSKAEYRTFQALGKVTKSVQPLRITINQEMYNKVNVNDKKQSLIFNI